jgi:tellurite resistance protein
MASSDVSMSGQSIRHLPVGMYGAVMGLAGLALAGRAMASALPGYVRAPAYLTEPWAFLAALAFAVLFPAYLVKWLRYPSEAREELTNPAQLGYCAALPLGMTLLAGAIAPYLRPLTEVLFLAGAALLFLLQVWGIRRLLEGGIDLAQVNAGWLILFLGGIAVPQGGLALGHEQISRALFGVSAAATPFVMGLVFYRAVLGPALPPPARPTWFILLVPPSLVYANGLTFFSDLAFLETLFPFATLLAAALLVYACALARWPFGAPWWAFTFPLDAYALAAARYAQSHPTPIAKALAAIAILLAVLFVVVALVRTLLALARGRLLVPTS